MAAVAYLPAARFYNASLGRRHAFHQPLTLRDAGRPDAQQRRVVGGADDHHATLQTFGAEAVLQELLHLPAALADQGDHGDVGAGVAGDAAEQGALTDAGTALEKQARRAQRS